MKKSVFTLLSVIIPALAAAQDSQTAYNFLRLPVSAHAAALGGDNISLIADDESLIFGNPALLSSVSDRTINLNYMNYMEGANMGSAAFCKTFGSRGTGAVSAQYIDYGTMKEVDENNVLTGSFHAKDISLAAYFSYMLTDRLSGGVAAKFVTSYIGSYNSIAAGVDLGLNYYDPEHELSLSLAGKNLGGQLKAYDDEFEKMPIDVQAGGTVQLFSSPVRLSATLVDLNHWNYKFAYHLVIGADVTIADNFWIGGGYNFRRANEMKISGTGGDESGHGAGLALGAGLNLERFKLNLAYSKYHVSSNSLVVNLAYTL